MHNQALQLQIPHAEGAASVDIAQIVRVEEGVNANKDVTMAPKTLLLTVRLEPLPVQCSDISSQDGINHEQLVLL
jgi:hypothetical protein